MIRDQWRVAKILTALGKYWGPRNYLPGNEGLLVEQPICSWTFRDCSDVQLVIDVCDDVTTYRVHK